MKMPKQVEQGREAVEVVRLREENQKLRDMLGFKKSESVSRWQLFPTEDLINLIIALVDQPAEKIGAMYDGIARELRIRARSGYDDEASEFVVNSSYPVGDIADREGDGL